MAQFSIVGGARTDLSATWAVQLVRTGPLAAIGASPAFGTGARTVRDVANGSVQTLAGSFAVLSVHSWRALFLTLIASIAGQAVA